MFRQEIRSPGCRVIRRRLLSTVVATVIVDVTTKSVAAHLPLGRRIGPFLSLHNHDFTLGVAGAPRMIMVLIMAVSLVVGAAAAVRRVHSRGAAPWAGGLLIGGAAANLGDRLLHGAVQDFIVIGPAVVNLADLAILAGMVTLCRHGRSTVQVGEVLRPNPTTQAASGPMTPPWTR